MPGERTFFLQARTGSLISSVALEKAQVATLADRLEDLIADVGQRLGLEVPEPGPVDLDALEVPLVEEFRVGAIAFGWDPATDQMLFELHGQSTDEDARPDGARRRGRRPAGPARAHDPAPGRRLHRPRPQGRRGRSPAVPLLPAAAGPGGSHLPAGERLQAVTQPPQALATGELHVLGRLAEASNLALLAEVTHRRPGRCAASTSPCRGSARSGTSPGQRWPPARCSPPRSRRCFGWDLIPPTDLARGGPVRCRDVPGVGRGRRRRPGRAVPGRTGARGVARGRRGSRRRRRADRAGPRVQPATCSGWSSSTPWSTTPTARAVTSCAAPTGRSSGSTTG